MPWLEASPMTQRRQFIADYHDGLFTMTELCERYAISRKSGYKWLQRFVEHGQQGLGDRSRAPHHCPHRIADDVARAAASCAGRIRPGAPASCCACSRVGIPQCRCRPSAPPAICSSARASSRSASAASDTFTRAPFRLLHRRLTTSGPRISRGTSEPATSATAIRSRLPICTRACCWVATPCCRPSRSRQSPVSNGSFESTACLARSEPTTGRPSRRPGCTACRGSTSGGCGWASRTNASRPPARSTMALTSACTARSSAKRRDRLLRAADASRWRSTDSGRSTTTSGPTSLFTIGHRHRSTGRPRARSRTVFHPSSTPATSRCASSATPDPSVSRNRLLFIANALKQNHIGLDEVDDGVWSIYFSNVLLARLDERDFIIHP